MKTKILFIITLALCIAGCKRSTQKVTEQKEQVTADTLQTPLFESNLRLGQKLKIGEIHRDTAIYLEYDNNGDYFMVFVEKNGQEIQLLTNSNGFEINRGDIVMLNWKMDSMWVAGDGEKLYITEWETGMHRIKKGTLTQWQREYGRQIIWDYAENIGDDYAAHCREAAEWYFAHCTTENKTLWNFLNNAHEPFRVAFSLWDEDPNPEEMYHAVHVEVQKPVGEDGYETVYTFGIRFEGRRFVYLEFDKDKNEYISKKI